MKSFKNIAAAVALFVCAGWMFASHASVWTASLLCGGGFYLLAAPLLGLSSGLGADLRDAVNLVRDPVDTVLDRVDALETPAGQPAAEEAKQSPLGRLMATIEGDDASAGTREFDPDAAIARHLAARENAGSTVHPVKTFGRKTA